MRKIATISILSAALTGCNKQIFDTTYEFDRAIIELPHQVVNCEIKSWTDFEDGDQIQITTIDGMTYLVHSSKVTLINNSE